MTDNDKDIHNADYYRERGRAKFQEKYRLQTSESSKGFKAINLKEFGKLYGAEKYEDVMADYKIALELNPNDYLVYLYMADVVNTIDEKNKYFDTAIKLNPNSTEPYLKKIYENADFRLWNVVQDTIADMEKANPNESEIIKNLRSQFPLK